MIRRVFNWQFSVVLIALLSVSQVSFAHEGHDHDHSHGEEPVGEHIEDSVVEGEDELEEAFQPVEMIMHHIKDAHGWHLFGEGDDAVSIPLPVILFSKEGGFDIFMSSEFHHDEAGKHLTKGKYLNYHGKIYLANAQGGLDFDEHHHPTNAMPLDFSITKNVFAMFISVIFLIIIFWATARAYDSKGMPRGIASFMEPLVLFVRNEIAVPNIGEDKADKFLPYLLTVFFFVWINNLLGLVPLFPGGANVTGNIAFTFTIAFFTLLITNISANKEYWAHIFWMPGVPVPVRPILAVVEVIGIFTKPFALMMRLFANITAGHILMLALFSLIFIFKTPAMSLVSVPFALFMNVLELLVAALQAFIFTLLSALFIGMAVAEHDHDHDHEHAADGH